ncbi:hypothetical protein A5765_22410 [Mycolicibacterium celeriflavum]|uniref:Uncharacterized protein n=1 Tax=Mycolicibacterium celeriflavum TaxID=1249101 RepID=A0A1X0BQ76_MYCCF|nr:DUF2339 domain-containing protein [Mycolicibacterium celeriflavum]MCV7240008.1 DUF2339 domain-containing protein [Mycolicibacterium celeriflavum]OBG20857.1 hypothetical protein A5765_22410 [Mycolicibacterium celeriflavum]ORA45412.1 hypothetical protein BST21_17650 [Mycolicibacterium celeriflavum]BBY42702.1 hypothetical protein MCEL_09970 [Mycolicibacterium celeriflavum]
MTEPHRAVIARLSADFAAISAQLARASTDLAELDRLLAPSWPPPPQVPQYVAPVHYSPPYVAPAPPPRPAPPPPPPPPPAARTPRDERWIGKLLAVAGVAVTLIGVVFLLVLAAQAGVLRPEIRVAAGAMLAAGLVVVARWLYARPGGRVGAIALAATGTAAAYMDVIAVTTIYEWVSAPAALVIAAVIGGGGLTLARRWNSEHLGLLVLVPLLVLAPVVVGGITLLLVAFMLALSAASLPVQLGRDWLWLHAARIAAATLPLLTALVGVYFDDGRDRWLAGACGIAALLAIAGALILLPRTANKPVMAVLTGAGVLPVLSVSLAVDRVVAALMAAALAAALLAIVLVGEQLPGVDRSVRRIWAVLSAVSALICVLVAFDGRIAGPVLLATALVVAAAGRPDATARAIAVGFALIGTGFYLSYAPPSALMRATATAAAAGISTLVASVLLAACAAVIVWSFPRRNSAAWAVAAAVAGYAVTTFAVTAGVLVGGTDGGFFAGHMAATICWIGLAAALFGYAARLPRTDRSLPIGGGLALVAAAMAKLFLFDLGTLDGIFRVVVFIVVGLVLLGMGAGYARLLERQDQQQNTPVTADTC